MQILRSLLVTGGALACAALSKQGEKHSEDVQLAATTIFTIDLVAMNEPARSPVWHATTQSISAWQQTTTLTPGEHSFVTTLTFSASMVTTTYQTKPWLTTHTAGTRTFTWTEFPPPVMPIHTLSAVVPREASIQSGQESISTVIVTKTALHTATVWVVNTTVTVDGDSYVTTVFLNSTAALNVTDPTNASTTSANTTACCNSNGTRFPADMSTSHVSSTSILTKFFSSSPTEASSTGMPAQSSTANLTGGASRVLNFEKADPTLTLTMVLSVLAAVAACGL